MSRGPDAATLLDRRLRIAAEAAGIGIAVVASDWTRWASATFNGARHRMTIASCSRTKTIGQKLPDRTKTPCLATRR